MPPTPPKDTLEPLPENGTPPRRRIPTAAALNAIHKRYLREDEVSSKIRAVAQSLIDNIAPYDPAELVEKGLGDMTNRNFGEAEAELTSALAPFVEILDNVPRVADVILKNEDPIDGHEKSERVSGHFDKMLKAWDDFFPELQRLAHHFVKDGLAVVVPRNERTWQWEAVPLGEFLTDRNTPTSDQRIEVCTIFREIPVSRLYRYIEDKESATKTGWKPAMVRKAIWMSANKQSKWKDESSHWEDFQRRIKEHNFDETEDYNKVGTVLGVVKEFDGKISTIMSSPLCDEGFLRESWSKYDNINQALVMFPYGVGTGATIHTVRGLSHKIYHTITESNKMLCSLIDNIMASSRNVLQGAPEAIASFQFQNVGPYSLMDKALTPVQIVNTNGGAMIDGYRLMQQIRQNTTGSYQSRAVTPEDGSSRSATEVKAQVMKENSLSGAQMTNFYAPYSKLLRETYRRAVSGEMNRHDDGYDLAQEFIAACKLDGISIDELRDFDTVRAVRAIGNGSPAMRQQATQELLQLSSGFDEVGKRQALLWAVANIQGIGFAAAEAFVPKGEPRQTVDHQIANMENTLFKLGQGAEITGEQNHVAHLARHFPFIKDVIEALKAQQLPEEEALKILRPAVDNATEHVIRLSENAMRQSEAGQMRKSLQNVTAFVNQLDQQVTERLMKEQRDMEAQAGGQPDPQQMIKIQEQQLRVQEQQEKARAQRELHEQKMEQIRANMALTDLKAARSMATSGRPVGRPTMIE